MTQQQLHRANGVIDLKMAQNTTIAILGMGSLGSSLAEIFGYPWKQLILIDPEDLEEHNIERHLLGKSWLGKPKVQGVKFWLVEHGMDAEKIVAIHDLAENHLRNYQVNLAFVAVDNRSAKLSADAWARIHQVPTIYGRIYPMGTGGDIYYLPQPEKLCYRCAAHFMGEEEYKGRQTQDYGIDITQFLGSDGNLQAVPALRWSVSAMAANMARLGLEHLGGATIPPHVCIDAFGWETVLHLEPGPTLTAVAQYIIALREIGALPQVRLNPSDDSDIFRVSVKNTRLELALTPWSACPNHGQSNSISDI